MRRTAPAGILMPFCALASAGPAFAHGFGETYNLPLPLWGAAGTVLISLVPIAVAYQVAHYYAYLPIQGQSTVSLLSDPLPGTRQARALFAGRSTRGC